MTATRTFVTIDRESIKSLLTSLLTSPNVKQRSLAISTSMLVDFNIVRSPLIETLAKENSVELLEKIGMVLAANPDREVLLDTYRAYRRGKQTMKAEFKQIVEMVADKLSIVLNKINTAEELLSEAEALYEEEIKAEKKKSAAKDADKASDAPPDGAEIGITKEQLATEDQSIQTILTSDKEDSKTKRAKATVIIWILVAVAWGGTIALVILKLLTGE
jgi:hypothetical protein